MSNKPIQILLVEDNRDDIALIDVYLKRASMEHEITAVAEKKEFLEMINSREFDIIVCDHSIPQFNSMEALEIASSNIPGVPFIVMTGSAREEDLIRVFEKGADNYVMKDNLLRLPSAIIRAIENKKLKSNS